MADIREQVPDSFFYMHTQVQILDELDRTDQARPLIERLLAADWKDSEFLAVCKKHGLLPATPSEP